jgi:hypothetical protein
MITYVAMRGLWNAFVCNLLFRNLLLYSFVISITLLVINGCCTTGGAVLCIVLYRGPASYADQAFFLSALTKETCKSPKLAILHQEAGE